MLKRGLLPILVLLFIIVVLVKAMEVFQVDVVEADASKFVLEDLRSRYPDADLEIMSTIQKVNELGRRYFELKAKVTEDPLSPCPKRSHIYYNYPIQNFVPQTPEIITTNCTVCSEGICTIAFPEEAVIASHTLSGTEVIRSYLLSNPDAVPTVSEGPESWLVRWDADGASSYYVVDLHRNGSVLSITRNEKS